MRRRRRRRRRQVGCECGRRCRQRRRRRRRCGCRRRRRRRRRCAGPRGTTAGAQTTGAAGAVTDLGFSAFHGGGVAKGRKRFLVRRRVHSCRGRHGFCRFLRPGGRPCNGAVRAWGARSRKMPVGVTVVPEGHPMRRLLVVLHKVLRVGVAVGVAVDVAVGMHVVVSMRRMMHHAAVHGHLAAVRRHGAAQRRVVHVGVRVSGVEHGLLVGGHGGCRGVGVKPAVGAVGGRRVERDTPRPAGHHTTGHRCHACRSVRCSRSFSFSFGGGSRRGSFCFRLCSCHDGSLLRQRIHGGFTFALLAFAPGRRRC